jgi:hypothetical protein
MTSDRLGGVSGFLPLYRSRNPPTLRQGELVLGWRVRLVVGFELGNLHVLVIAVLQLLDVALDVILAAFLVGVQRGVGDGSSGAAVSPSGSGMRTSPSPSRIGNVRDGSLVLPHARSANA